MRRTSLWSHTMADTYFLRPGIKNRRKYPSLSFGASKRLQQACTVFFCSVDMARCVCQNGLRPIRTEKNWKSPETLHNSCYIASQRCAISWNTKVRCEGTMGHDCSMTRMIRFLRWHVPFSFILYHTPYRRDNCLQAVGSHHGKQHVSSCRMNIHILDSMLYIGTLVYTLFAIFLRKRMSSWFWK